MFNTASETVAKTQLNISHLVHILDDFPMAALIITNAAFIFLISYLFANIWECQSVRSHSQELN
jgi:hypothetical protein